MGTLVDDLLQLARLDQGRPLERAPVDLGRARRATPCATPGPSTPTGRSRVDAPSRVVVLGDDGPPAPGGGQPRRQRPRAHAAGHADRGARSRRGRRDARARGAPTRARAWPRPTRPRAFERFYRADPLAQPPPRRQRARASPSSRPPSRPRRHRAPSRPHPGRAPPCGRAAVRPAADGAVAAQPLMRVGELAGRLLHLGQPALSRRLSAGVLASAGASPGSRGRAPCRHRAAGWPRARRARRRRHRR